MWKMMFQTILRAGRELNIVDINIPPPATTKTWKFEAKKSAEISHLNQTFKIDRNMVNFVTPYFDYTLHPFKFVIEATSIANV